MGEWAEKIKAKQAERGISSAQLARVLGVTQATVCRWRKGELKPGADAARMLRRWIDGEIDDASEPVRKRMGRPHGMLTTKRGESALARLVDQMVKRYGGVQLAADAVGVSPGTICQLRQGDAGARWATVEKIVKAAGGRIVIEV